MGGFLGCRVCSSLPLLNCFPECVSVYTPFRFRTWAPSLVVNRLIANLQEVKWYLVVVLVIISLNTSEVEYLFICLRAIQVYPCVNCLISLEHFLLGLSFFVNF